MDLSTLTIRELFAELTLIEDALHGRTEERLTPSRRRVLERHQDQICRELRSRTPGEVLPAAAGPAPPPVAATVPA